MLTQISKTKLIMKMTLIASAAALVLPIASLSAQESDALTSQSGNSGQGFFAYADYFRYIGAGSPGVLVESEALVNTILYVSAIQSDPVYKYGTAVLNAKTTHEPSGSVTGGTVGYTWTTKNSDRFYVQLGYRAGTLDSDIGCVSEKGDVITGLYPNYSTSTTYTTDYSYIIGYSQDTKEYRIQLSYSPSDTNFITFGLEYMHGIYESRVSSILDGKKVYILADTILGFYQDSVVISEPPTVVNKDNEEFSYYGFKQTTDDILAHVTLKTPVFNLYKQNMLSFSMMPRIDMGLGYSLRDGENQPGKDESVYTTNAMGILSKDRFIYEGTATLGFYLNYSAQTVIIDLGYRYKTDLGTNDNGTNQEGLYARLGYTYSW